MIAKLSSLILISLTFLLIGCTSAQETTTSLEETNSEEESQNQEVQNEISNEVQRNETNLRDETQEQIETALRELSGSGDYRSPSGSILTQVTIEVDENNIIQNVEVSSPTNDRTSQNYIEKYNEGIKEELIGVSLNEAQSPEKVNGSSLTSKGFNEALDAIKSQ